MMDLLRYRITPEKADKAPRHKAKIGGKGRPTMGKPQMWEILVRVHWRGERQVDVAKAVGFAPCTVMETARGLRHAKMYEAFMRANDDGHREDAPGLMERYL